ncbi:MAG: sigma-70 family RNA polymerase sigma factor [Polyangiaceae bacterium]|nr:sigma-70 family RNA polymerase sigma factor [Myxococcales bacterium]MCB9587156.1 sigma-70 family RNA polymerase sigma factor [Polyangiaceae bacterium]
MFRDPVVSRYDALATSFPSLSREDELELAWAWKNDRDPRARERLVGSQLRAVTAIARKLRAYGVPLADLMAEGNVGLLQALDKFEPELGYRFGTYAAFWIRARMINHVLATWSIVQTRSGVMRSRMFFKLRRERSRLQAKLGDPELVKQELAKQFDLSDDAVQAMLQRLDAGDVSLDRSVREDASPMVEQMEADAESQESTLMREQRQRLVREVVERALKDLDARERRIVRERLMAEDGEALSLAELGRRMGISRERARQLESRARKKLAESLSSQAAHVAAA